MWTVGIITNSETQAVSSCKLQVRSFCSCENEDSILENVRRPRNSYACSLRGSEITVRESLFSNGWRNSRNWLQLVEVSWDSRWLHLHNYTRDKHCLPRSCWWRRFDTRFRLKHQLPYMSMLPTWPPSRFRASEDKIKSRREFIPLTEELQNRRHIQQWVFV